LKTFHIYSNDEILLGNRVLASRVRSAMMRQIVTIVVKFEEINLKFKKFVKVRDVIKFEKVRDPHSVTAASRGHSLL